MGNKKIQLAIVTIAIIVIGGLFIFQEKSSQHKNTTAELGTNSLQGKLTKIYQQIPSDAGKVNFLKQSENLTKDVDAELVDLDSQIITCSPNVDSLLGANPTSGGSCVAAGTAFQNIDGLYLGGQCCGTLMDTKEYHENLEKLQAYKSMSDIPLDPMHTPVQLAKKWIDYDNSTTLTPYEQKIYDQAYAISTEKPCCCKCWHYYTNEGVAKKMIKDGVFNAGQIAGYWDASDICGA